MKHSTKAWEMAAPIYGAIVQHSFNQELMKGTLNPQKFRYYLEQDSLFLKNVGACFTLIASKIQSDYVSTFLEFALFANTASGEIVEKYSPKGVSADNSNKLSRATESFSNYLLNVPVEEPIEVAVAAILPFFWVYQECAFELAKGSVPNNPYAPWIASITSENISRHVRAAITVFDALAEKTTEEIRKKMLEAFSKSTMLEWHLWNDVYEAIVFENV